MEVSPGPKCYQEVAARRFMYSVHDCRRYTLAAEPILRSRQVTRLSILDLRIVQITPEISEPGLPTLGPFLFHLLHLEPSQQVVAVAMMPCVCHIPRTSCSPCKHRRSLYTSIDHRRCAEDILDSESPLLGKDRSTRCCVCWRCCQHKVMRGDFTGQVVRKRTLGTVLCLCAMQCLASLPLFLTLMMDQDVGGCRRRLRAAVRSMAHDGRNDVSRAAKSSNDRMLYDALPTLLLDVTVRYRREDADNSLCIDSVHA